MGILRISRSPMFVRFWLFLIVINNLLFVDQLRCYISEMRILYVIGSLLMFMHPKIYRYNVQKYLPV